MDAGLEKLDIQKNNNHVIPQSFRYMTFHSATQRLEGDLIMRFAAEPREIARYQHAETFQRS
jgi:hypothetical protein